MGHPIGERQRWAWLAAAASAVTATCLCGLSWLSVLLGAAGACGLWLALDAALRPCGMAPMLATAWGGLGKLAVLLTMAWTVAALAWAANLAVTAFPMVEGYPVLGWTLLALVAWGSYKGAAASARCAGVLVVFLAALYGLVAVFAVPDVTAAYLRPSVSWLDSCTALGLFLLPAGVFYVPCRRRQSRLCWPWALVMPLAAAGLCAITAGVLSPELSAIAPTPLYLLAQSVSLFGVMERIEPLLSVAMTLGVFCLMASLVCAFRSLGAQLKPWKGLGPLACLLAAAAMGPARYLPGWCLAAGAGLFWIVLPFLTLLRCRCLHPRRHSPPPA